MNSDIIHDDFPPITAHPASYYEYRKTALKWIQAVSGRQWTDYNIHDPGVTILEVLCYALTEVEYKLRFSMEEILYASHLELDPVLRSNAFYLAEEILTTGPVTANDYRKLIIDRVDSVNNAWIIPTDQKYNTARFRVLLLTEKAESYSTEESEAKRVQKEANDKSVEETRLLLRKYRGFGMIFEEIKVVVFEHLSLQLDIYLDSRADTEEVLAQLFFNLNEELLSPIPHRVPFEELVADGMKYEEIFDGPSMINGIITDDHLVPLLSEISLVQIKKTISATPGIEMIDHLQIVKKEDLDENGKKKKSYKQRKFIQLKKGTVPFFSPKSSLAIGNDLRVYKHGEPVEFNERRTMDLLDQKVFMVRRDYKIKNQEQSATYTLEARDRNIQDYYSIRNDFPLLYGLTHQGFPLIQNQQPYQTDQLRDYLLPFEEFLASTFKRLAKTSNFFSIYRSTYQSAEDDRTLIIGKETPAINGKLNGSMIAAEDSSISDGENYVSYENLKRRDRFLNHLLARFDVYLYEAFEMDHREDDLEHLDLDISKKERVLQNLVQITANRSLFDYDLKREHLSDKKSNKDSYTLTSLEEELYLRMGILEPPQRKYYEVVAGLVDGIKEIDSGLIESRKIKANEKDKTEFKYNNDFVYLDDAGYFSESDDILAEFLALGTVKSSYMIYTNPEETEYFVLLGSASGTNNKLISKEKTREKALKCIDDLVANYRNISSKSEGFYLVDHSLLQGAEPETKFTDYRISMVFPSWGTHFQKPAFQKQTADLLEYLVPAHIHSECIWLGFDDMKEFEDLYEEWLGLYNSSVPRETMFEINKQMKDLIS